MIVYIELASQVTLSGRHLVFLSPLPFLPNDQINAVILYNIQVIPDVIQIDFGPHDCIQAI